MREVRERIDGFKEEDIVCVENKMRGGRQWEIRDPIDIKEKKRARGSRIEP